jgi:hypothetical protein
MYYNFRYYEPNKTKIMNAFTQFAIITHEVKTPRSVVVNKINLEPTRDVLLHLGLQQIPVSSSGGCMRSELWLEA